MVDDIETYPLGFSWDLDAIHSWGTQIYSQGIKVKAIINYWFPPHGETTLEGSKMNGGTTILTLIYRERIKRITWIEISIGMSHR